ncbi:MULTISPECIES: VanZ family protein [Streptomyces]|uniref:VanZ family protein n=1 Tax=Streptomyces TaxID=1883 RepID=UPI000F7A3E6B|nr:VanZ family protein [Streptomyces sp. WAC07149]GLX17976.1 VanZ family protein [Streptomyces lavendulae subsp. lavendulae]GLX26320.1 VanZ family protein [Streptomyces lavendulae subsp. lavendulae]
MHRHEGSGSAATATKLPVRSRLLSGALLAAHLLLVGWLTLSPLDVPWAAAANLTPLEGIRADLAYGPLEAARRIGEGLALLAPLGVLLPLAGGRLAPGPLAAWSSLVRTGAAAVLISLGIEMLQTAVPGRVLDVDALLLNTAGVVIVHLAVVPVLRRRLRRTHASQGPTPRITRVGIGPWTEVLSAVPREY